MLGEDRQFSIFELADKFPPTLLFIPTQRVLQKMIIRSTQIKVGEDQTPEQVCLTEFNYKERRRAFDENNLEEEVYPIYQSMRVLPPDIGYP